MTLSARSKGRQNSIWQAHGGYSPLKRALKMRIGIDLGGTKIELIALSDEGREILRQRVATPQGDYGKTVRVIVDMIEQAEAELGQRGSVGVGTPGAVSRATGLMKNCNSTCLNGQPLQGDLQVALRREVRLANDANCFALSEATDGAAAGVQIVFGVIIGTGCGAGVVVNRHILTGANAIAGEWGHNPLPWPCDEERPGPACYCGQAGCIETWLSGPGLSRDLQRVSGMELPAHLIAERQLMAMSPAKPPCSVMKTGWRGAWLM
jgi:predicted NBD/HSP70 family sugar kinase